MASNTPQGNTPQGNTPQGNTQQGNTPQGNTPQGNTPQDNPSGQEILALLGTTTSLVDGLMKKLETADQDLKRVQGELAQAQKTSTDNNTSLAEANQQIQTLRNQLVEARKKSKEDMEKIKLAIVTINDKMMPQAPTDPPRNDDGPQGAEKKEKEDRQGTNENNSQRKYLKYKSKYINLKRRLNLN